MARPLRAGIMDRRIVIEEPIATQNAAGEEVPVWTEFARRFAEKRDLAGREFDAAARINAEITTEWRIRFLPGLKRTMRISYKGEVYNIRHIGEINRREGMAVMTTAAVT